MHACRRVDRHGLHNGEGLYGRISNILEKISPEALVHCRHHITMHQTARQVSSFGPDITDIEENLPGKLPLDTEASSLHMRRDFIPGPGPKRGWTLPHSESSD